MSSLDEIRARRQMMRDKRAHSHMPGTAAAAPPSSTATATAAAASPASSTAASSSPAAAAAASALLPLKRKQSLDQALMPPPHPTTAATALSGVPAGSAAGPAAAAEKKARVDSAAAHASPSIVSPRMATNSAYSNALMPILAAAAPPVADVDVASLLSYQSVLDRAERSSHSEIDELLNAPTTKQRAVAAPFAAQQRGFNKVCSRRSRDACRALRKEEQLRRAAELGLRPDHPDYPRLAPCEDIHFVPVLRPQTQQHLGDCSYLDRCQTQSCPFIHYSIDPIDRHRVVLDAPAPAASAAASNIGVAAASASAGGNGLAATALMPAAAAAASHVIGPARPPEWICCDIRTLDVSVLGKFDLIMLDPPWRIRMDLPYDAMGDAEMLATNIAPLQDEGVCCVWVISQSHDADARALDLGRRCLERWGYRPAGQLLWVKVDQLSRLRRMGRTGHWLNHTKEHCLIGIKGNPRINRGLDCDVIVAGTRETSRKPDEQYRVFERLSPGGRKLEIFGRQHNVRPNWLTLGNQLDGVHIVQPELKQRIQKRYGVDAVSGSWLGEPAPANPANPSR